ncbi:hypothetical protein M0638_28080 [Roseomonas sp. NAR14]|uniref:Uncharacterized protein n=1 Tax=Roseomonas acroporae TaxID=2937791 RepID=A0A9X1YG14_9PROT|nr:hypothetical protein [Roseomonas acroporae]MCK8788213.1 hypothetical protein [Roseomonas acroporae]
MNPGVGAPSAAAMLAGLPSTTELDIVGQVERLAAASYDAGLDVAARTLFATAELLRAQLTSCHGGPNQISTVRSEVLDEEFSYE